MADWEVSGTVLIGCNCDYGCPCNFNAPPTTGDCEGNWTWHIEKGRYGDVELDGLTLAIFADWPKAIHEGGGKAVAYYDERADERQSEALENLVRGGEGGPWGIFINTYELLDIVPAPFQVNVDGEHSSYKIGDVAELQMEPIKNPVSGAASSSTKAGAPPRPSSASTARSPTTTRGRTPSTPSSPTAGAS